MNKNLVKLDMKDRKILYELDLNCRQSCSKIAKKVGISTEVVNYRIKKLEEREVIKQYILLIDSSKLGIIKFKILFSLQHIPSKKLNEIIDTLKRNKNVKWLASCNGSYDLIICLGSDSLNDINNLKEWVLRLFKNYIFKKAICINMNTEVYNREFLIENKSSLNRTRIIASIGKKAKVDELDIKILKKLSEHARKSVLNIAYELKQSTRVIDYRIKQLIKKEVITGFTILLDYLKLGIKFYKLFIYLENSSKEKINEIALYLKNNKNNVFYSRALADWDLEAQFEVYSDEEFNQILGDIKDKFSGIIKRIEVVTINKEHKYLVY